MSRIEERSSGFTLLEVLVAFVILGLAFSVTVAVIGPAFIRLGADNEEQSATLYAESLLARVGADVPLADGERSGVDGDLAWIVTIAPWALPTSDQEQGVSPTVHPHSVSVSVSWRHRSGRRTFTLRTIKLQIGS